MDNKEIKKHIIITENESEVRHLKKLFDKSYDEETFNKGFWEQPQQDFNKNWNWYFDENNNLSGASGHGEPEYTIKRLGRPVIYFSTLKMLFPTQADKVDAEDKEFTFSVWYIEACENNGIDPRERVPAHRIFNWFKDNFLSSQAQSKEGSRDGWISVEDRLPDFEVKVIVFGEAKGMSPSMGGAYQFITMRKNLKGTMLEKEADRHVEENQFYAVYVTHWMPLPKPPIPSHV